MARASRATILSQLARLIGLLVLAGVVAAGFLLPYIGGAGLAAKAGADKFLDTRCNLTISPVQQKTTLLAKDGKTVIATLFDQNRSVIPLSEVPQSVVDALISTEDRRFYSHHGVDMRGLLRGVLRTSDGDTQGASTLTEQYVKQVRYYQAISANDMKAAQAAIDQNLDRKLADAQCALKIEKEYSKQQILSQYLNIAFFGENAYGIQVAAQTYFGVPASKLTVPQAATLVGLVQAPSAYDPFNHMSEARARRDVVLDNMAEVGDISQADAAKYKATPIKLAPRSTPARGCSYANPAIANAGFFCDYALEYLAEHGLSNSQVNTGGYTIVTTLDPKLQNDGQGAIWQTALDPKNDYLLALPSVDPTTGAVTSMISTKHYGTRKLPNGQEDPAYTENKIFTDAYAGSGSTYKYFTTIAALNAGISPSYQLTTSNNSYTVKNCPTDPSGATPPYTVHNAGNYSSTMPLSTALPASSNTYFVAMEDQLFGCDLSPIVNTALNLGLTGLNQPDKDEHGNETGRTIAQAIVADHSATFTLGQTPTSVLQLTGAFGAVANDGVFCAPTPIASIKGPTGQPVALPKPAAGCKRAFSPYVARTLVNVMTADTNTSYGTSGRFFSGWYGNGGSPVAGKTGTNNSCTVNPQTGICEDDGKNSSLWFVGITPHLVSASALINPDNPQLTIAGVPGIAAGSDGSDMFGAFASTFWLDAYQPALAAQPGWSWQSAQSTPGQQVPDVTRKSLADATATLTAAGFKVAQYPVPCGSSAPVNQVAYFSPAIATPGDTVSVCLSSGIVPYVYVPPPPPPTTPANTATPGASGHATASAGSSAPGRHTPGGTPSHPGGRPTPGRTPSR